MGRSRQPCQRCGGSKPSGGGRRLCDDCSAVAVDEERKKRKDRQRRRYLANREVVLERSALRRKDPEYRARKAEAARRWDLAHPERVRNNRRRYWAKKKYGLTLEELDALVARGCAICGVKEDPQRGDRRHGRLCVDHDHATGQIRDALCHSCNAGLGAFADDPGRLRAAADYLETHKEN